ncbi:hypothetical protein Tco_1556217 [Tanacetum coccineum]
MIDSSREVVLSSSKRVRFTSPTPSPEVRESSAAGAARQDRPTIAREDLYGFIDMVDAPPRCSTGLSDHATIVEERELPACNGSREIKKLRRSRIPIIKVRWNSKRGPEFTWEREDQFREKYPHLFTKTAPSKNVAS